MFESGVCAKAKDAAHRALAKDKNMVVNGCNTRENNEGLADVDSILNCLGPLSHQYSCDLVDLDGQSVQGRTSLGEEEGEG